MQLQVLNTQGQPTGRTVELSDAIYGIEPHEHVVYLAVKQYLANQRQGTHKAKTRKEIHGSTRKLHKQKGTGGSRKGDIKNPLYRGGGRVHGPVPRDYSEKLPKKVKALARKSVLASKAQNGGIVVVEDFQFAAPKTKQYLDVLGKLNVVGQKSLLLTGEINENVFLSSRNVPTAQVTTATDFNVFEVLKANHLVLTESAVERINQIFAD
jgi:large subunit ribosomal protein L4